MKFFLRSLALLMVLVGLLSVFGCASTKKKEGDAAGAAVSDTGAVSEGLNLELEGDSDSQKAGALRTVYFPYDSYALSDDSRNVLGNNADFLKKHDSVKVQIEGHCDERGGIQYNLALGERRAQAVRDFLGSLGVANQRMSIISYGKERPLAFGHSEDVWSKNRRGNFVVVEK